MPGEILASKGNGFAREMRGMLTPSPVREFWHKEDESIHPLSRLPGEKKKKKRKKRGKERKKEGKGERRERKKRREQQSNMVGITLLTVACPTTALADHKTASHIHVVFAARRQGTKHTTSRRAL